MKTINEITNFIYQEKTEATNLQFFKGVFSSNVDSYCNEYYIKFSG